MGHLASHFESISRLHFEPIPTRVVKPFKIVRCDRTIAFITAEGSNIVYTNSNASGKYFYPLYNTNDFDDLLEATWKLGLVSKKDYESHMDTVRKMHAENNKKWHLKTLQEISEEYGIKFTKKQLAKLTQEEYDKNNVPL